MRSDESSYEQQHRSKHDVSLQTCCPTITNDLTARSLEILPTNHMQPCVIPNTLEFASDISLKENKAAYTYRCTVAVKMGENYGCESRSGGSCIPRISMRMKADATIIAMSVIRNENKRKLVTLSRTIDYMVVMLYHGNQKDKEIGACALHRLAVHPKNRSLIAQRGAIPPLLDLVKNGTSLQKNQAVAAIAAISVQNNHNKILISQAGGISPLVQLTQNGSDKQKSLAVRALYCLAKDVKIRDEISQRGGIAPIIELAINNDTAPNLRRYARAFLQLFKAKNCQ